MVTDAQVEAALAEFRRRWPEVSPSKDMMRACLEAAERAAWSTDMDAAPRDVELLVYTHPDDDTPVFSGRVMRDDDHARSGGANVYTTDFVVRATAWRPLPQPPAETGGRNDR